MSLTVDDLVKIAVAAPHLRAQRVVLADAIDEHQTADAAIAAAVRDDARGPQVLRAVWQQAQDKEAEPDYRLLWAVVTFGLDRPAAPAAPPVVIVPAGVPDGGDDAEEDNSPWSRRRRQNERRWLDEPAGGPRVAPLTPHASQKRDRDRDRRVLADLQRIAGLTAAR